MDKLVRNWLLPNWQRKLVSLLAAILIWSMISQSTTESKTLIGVPIRVVNLPPNRTIEGLSSSGLLNRRMTMVVTGQKKVLEELEPDDVEITLDAADAPKEWLVQISKKNLTSLNPHLDIASGISQVSHQEFLIKLSRLITERVPIHIECIGKLPRGYDFLGIWPQTLIQVVSGPEEEVEILKRDGLSLVFDLDRFTKEELADLTPLDGHYFSDELSFIVPESWKVVTLPFAGRPIQPINDPEAESLRLDFLRKDYIPLNQLLSIRLFYPLNYIDTLNPDTYSLAKSDHIIEKNGVAILKTPLMAYDVSQLFLDIVKDHMEIAIIAAPVKPGEELKWSVEFVEPQSLEDRYVAFQHKRHPLGALDRRSEIRMRENLWRTRFRYYMQNISLWKTQSTRLDLDSFIEGNHIYVDEAN